MKGDAYEEENTIINDIITHKSILLPQGEHCDHHAVLHSINI